MTQPTALSRSSWFRLFLLPFALLLLDACAENRPGSFPEAPKGGGYKVGQPYQVGGNWYYPRENYSYDESGIASWYGSDFEGHRTANGEIYNKNELTAAHKTLPLPSLARVTNLDNGRSIVVRINDRGPFSGARIIDLTQRGAQLLGFERQGTAKVRVQVLADESKAIADAMRHYGRPAEQAPIQTAAYEQSAPSNQSITSEPLADTTTQPPTKDQVKKILATIKPVQEVRQLPVTGQHNIFVQAGAFTQYENAARLSRSLARVGSATVVEADVLGVHYFRVRLGPVPDVAHADELLRRVQAAGPEKARIVVD